MKKILFAIALLQFLILLSCKSDYSKLMPAITGKAGELLLVIEDALWESKVGDKFVDIFQQEVNGILQPEPMFDLIHIPSKAFTKMLQKNRNIIRVKISDDLEKESILIQNDVWATPQTLIKINAKSKESMIKLLEKNQKKLVAIILEAEQDRLIASNKKYEDLKISKMLAKHHNIHMYVPKGYSVAVDTADFVWLEYEPRQVKQGIFVYHYNYTDTNTFSLDYLIDKRDSILEKWVETEIAGSFMGTDRRFPTSFEELNYKGAYAVMVRGWWETKGKFFMGGPFVSLTTIDKKTNRVVTVEGFVYAPKFRKRNYLRKVESIISTLDFPK